MSLIEKALEKMQQSQRQGTASAGPALAPAPAPFAKGSASAPRTPDVGRIVTAPPPPQGYTINLDQPGLRASGLLPPEHQARQINQQYQRIKRPLMANAFGRGGSAVRDGRVIMVASAVPGEGKTFTSINLALSLALEKEVQVILVDADLPKPHISKLLNIHHEPGLTDVLQDASLDIESVIHPTNIPALCVMPAGTRSHNATELLASERMAACVARLTSMDPNRIVLFDSPPLLLTTESQVLSHVAGQVVVVVRAGVTQQGAVLDAVSHIPEGRRVSLILNQIMADSSTNYYYYGNGNESDGADSTRAG